jgi:type VI secretion system secreted protein VgrG
MASAAEGIFTQDNRVGRLTTPLGPDALLMTALTASERISESYVVTIDAISEAPRALHQVLGRTVGVSFAAPSAPELTRDFAGILWEYHELGHEDRWYRYRLVLRPQMELLTLSRDSRIFQDQTRKDVITAVLGSDFEARLQGTYDLHEYCVQFQESDFAFVSRLMEMEGIHYYFEHAGTTSKLVLADNRTAHKDVQPPRVEVARLRGRDGLPLIDELTERRALGPVKVTLADYDFEAPTNRYLASATAPEALGDPPQGREGPSTQPGWKGDAEVYEFPGQVIFETGKDKAGAKGKQAESAQRYADLWLGSERRRIARSFAQGRLFSAAPGHRVKLVREDGQEVEYLIVATEHGYSGPGYLSGGGDVERFQCALELMPASEQYRPGRVTPRPRAIGPQSALVVGPAGEEIYTDAYGRIKVQFPWDRTGKNDEKSSCFVRVMQSVAGKKWGSFVLPRIGQEVVVEFLDGDPDRPLVTGAVYNAENMPPETLPDNKTQSGYRTLSTKGGGGFNRWWFEDKKGSEKVWFHAQKDYDAWILNGSETRLYSSGNRTTTFATGNDEKIIDKGNLTTTIKKGNEVRTIETGTRTTKIKDTDALEIETGDRTANVKMGNDTLEVGMGNLSTNVKMGNIDIKAALGKITVEAMQSIELKVGGSSITIDQIGVTIKGTVKVEIKGIMIDSSADAMHVVKGGIVMIN